jgi:hypothetical protein
LDGDASIMLSSTTKLNNNQKDEDEEKMMKKEDYIIFFDRKIDIVTAGLRPYCNTILYRISKDNALTIANYVISMKSEINLSDHYRADVIKLLCKSCVGYVYIVVRRVICNSERKHANWDCSSMSLCNIKKCIITQQEGKYHYYHKNQKSSRIKNKRMNPHFHT